MNHDWDQLAAALRMEIEGYGSLLALFEEQQRRVFERQPDRVLELNVQIEAETVRLGEVRRHREQLVAAYAVAAGFPAGSSLRSLVGLFALEVRPLLEALRREINLLVLRVRQVSRHNRLLLQRAIQSHEELLRSLAPERRGQTYGPAGRVATGVGRPLATVDLAG